MSKVAWLFPGQGSQAVGMGIALAEAEPAARAVLQDADAALGFPLSKLMAEGPEETLKLTEHTQPAILTHSTMVVRAFAHRLPKLPQEATIASSPGDKEALFEPANSKVYRHPTFFPMPDEVKHL